jgi:hydroxymethylpyrimidine pyrophosphatase-like HAD family hydrolase
MRYMCLVTDYDGTLASDSRVSPETISALDRLHRSGRKLVLATGRLLPELLDIFPDAKLFDRVVAENGAVLYWPYSASRPHLRSSTNSVDGVFLDSRWVMLLSRHGGRTNRPS